jgi:flagellar biosynthesis/type III secretory pathway protein FliH
VSEASFVALAELLRKTVPVSAAAIEPPDDDIVDGEVAPSVAPVASTAGEILAAIREAKLFRARLEDALAEALARLVRELAAGVLARELRIAPCDLAALLRATLAQAPVVRVRVAPDDLRSGNELPFVADSSLQPGDAIVELAGGALDARLGVRLSAVLEAVA